MAAGAASATSLESPKIPMMVGLGVGGRLQGALWCEKN